MCVRHTTLVIAVMVAASVARLSPAKCMQHAHVSSSVLLESQALSTHQAVCL